MHHHMGIALGNIWYLPILNNFLQQYNNIVLIEHDPSTCYSTRDSICCTVACFYKISTPYPTCTSGLKLASCNVAHNRKSVGLKMEMLQSESSRISTNGLTQAMQHKRITTNCIFSNMLLIGVGMMISSRGWGGETHN